MNPAIQPTELGRTLYAEGRHNGIGIPSSAPLSAVAEKNKQIKKKEPMENNKKLTFATVAAIALTLLFRPSTTPAADRGPLRITFKKCFVEDVGPFGGHYEGNVAGDCGVGTVIFTFVSVVPGRVIWPFSGYYKVTTPECSFTAFCDGIDNLRSGSGHDVLNGLVIDGDHQGSQVHVDAQDTDGGACSQGSITITPRK